MFDHFNKFPHRPLIFIELKNPNLTFDLSDLLFVPELIILEFYFLQPFKYFPNRLFDIYYHARVNLEYKYYAL